MNNMPSKSLKQRDTDTSKLDKQTQYDLLLYDFIVEDILKNPYKYIIRTCKLRNLENDAFFDYCLVVTSGLYTISVIKTKIDSLPDNNNFLPAIYRSTISNKQCQVIERPGQIVSEKLYKLFTDKKTR